MKRSQPRRQRIPKRGPGVAELEKILKEQENRSDQPSPSISSSSSPFLFSLNSTNNNNNNNNNNNTYYYNDPLCPLPPPPPPSLLPPPHPLNAPPSAFIVPAWNPLLRNLDHIPTAASRATVLAALPPPTFGDGGSGVPLSERSLFPIPTELNKSDTSVKNLPLHFSHFQSTCLTPPPQQHNLEYYYSSMVNYTPAGSGSSAPAAAATMRLFNQIEHPSSQRSTDYIHIPEDEKMVGTKRVIRPFSMESHTDNSSRNKVPIFQNTVMKESSSSSSSSSPASSSSPSSSSLEMNHQTALNLDSMPTNLRDAQMSLMKSRKNMNISCSSYQLTDAAEESNFITLTSTAPSNSTHQEGFRHEFASFNFLPNSQENMADWQQRGGGRSGTHENKPISLMFESSKEKMGIISKESSNSCCIGSSSYILDTPQPQEDDHNGIDLNLKL